MLTTFSTAPVASTFPMIICAASRRRITVGRVFATPRNTDNNQPTNNQIYIQTHNGRGFVNLHAVHRVGGRVGVYHFIYVHHTLASPLSLLQGFILRVDCKYGFRVTLFS